MTSTRRMAPRKALGLTATLLGVLLCAVFLVLLVRGKPGRAADFGSTPASTASSPPPMNSTPAPSSARPTGVATGAPSPADAGPARIPAPQELSIPRLGLSAPVDPVGVAEDGQTEVPPDPDRVGWYRFSPAPGSAAGSSVIVGHVDAKGRGLGVLDGLNEVRQGDRVLIGRKDGSTVSYEITARRTVGKKVLAASDAFRREGRPVLTLITCAGPYLPDAGGYQNNLVVTAVEAAP
ncbi:class F sortase [Streptomyces sp. NE5-10]|uniref:class F sortase n=1 Tax=Streptomyces sp. NE5-10 TaxID=2759674 RepID=UPI001905A3E9|nr:class F sortase [Streptomyces sp. NE5-10]